jgi:hypothetical protein
LKYAELTDNSVQQFIELGFVVVENAFPRAQALLVTDFLWERLAERDIDRNNRASWTKPRVHIRENYDSPLFGACMTGRLQRSIADLAGAGRTADRDPNAAWGWWPVNFAVGADSEWDVPRSGWHWDGHHFRHTVTTPDQGLLLLPHFSDLSPHGGGTLLAAGSHKIVARYLARQPEPMDLTQAIAECNQAHPWLAELTGLTTTCEDRIEYFMSQEWIDDAGTRLQVVESDAQPGDVIICHPFLYHAASQNHSGSPRFMCNRTSPLKEPMQLDRPDSDYSPIEISIDHALSV